MPDAKDEQLSSEELQEVRQMLQGNRHAKWLTGVIRVWFVSIAAIATFIYTSWEFFSTLLKVGGGK